MCRESICHNRVAFAAEAYLTWASDKWQAAGRREDPIDHCLKMIAFRLEVILSNESPSQLQQWVENLLKCKGDIMIGLVERQWRLEHHLRTVPSHVGINEVWREESSYSLWFKYVTYFKGCVLEIHSITAKWVVHFFNRSNYTVFIAPKGRLSCLCLSGNYFGEEPNCLLSHSLNITHIKRNWEIIPS